MLFQLLCSRTKQCHENRKQVPHPPNKSSSLLTTVAMKIPSFVLLVCHVFVTINGYVEIQRHYEFEDVLTRPALEERELWVWRSEASNYKTLRLVDEEQKYHIQLKVCIEPAEDQEFVTITLDDIRYANDGPFDYIFVSFEGRPWSVYATYERWAHGHDWNIFRNTGRNGVSHRLRKGVYTIDISVLTDKWGLELDKIRLNAEYQRLDSSLFCGGSIVNLHQPAHENTDDKK